MNSTDPASKVLSERSQQLRDMPASSVTLVVPTYNERHSIVAFYREAASALERLDWQIIFVDDNSPDGTAAMAEELAAEDRRVHLILRFHERGLTSAVLQGVWSANTTYVVVTDADLQHDLRKIPEMVHLLNADHADLIIGTRDQEGANTEGLSSSHRIWLSSVGRKIARYFAPIPITDPLSGFFAFRRKELLPILAKVDPLGFKILFDILWLRNSEIRISEISYQFRRRHAGDSKLDWRVQWDFLIQILYHVLKKVLPHDLISFILVGASGAVVQFTTEHLCVGTGLPSATAAATGVSAAILWNFLFNHYLTFHRALTFNIDLLVKFILYTLAVMIGIMLNISAATFSLQKLYTNDFIASILGMCVDTIWRFAVAKAVIWRR